MGKKDRSNVLLVEILIVILFFMLSATVLVRVFAAARNMTARTAVETKALAQAQNVADTLYTSNDIEAALLSMDFNMAHETWSRDYEGFTLCVTGEEEKTQAGDLWQGEVSAFYSKRDPNTKNPVEEALFSLPCARYREVSP